MNIFRLWGNMVPCCVCQDEFEDKNFLEIHLATTHVFPFFIWFDFHIILIQVFYTPYQCEFCQSALFPSDFALRRHYTNDHHQEVFNVSCLKKHYGHPLPSLKIIQVIYRVSPELESKRNDLEQLISKSIATTSSTSSGRPKRMKAPKQDTDASTSQLAQFVFSDMHRFLKQANNVSPFSPAIYYATE
jgi:hypothetical protein